MSEDNRRQRGRPKKKPDYDREKEIQDLVQQAVTLYQIPYDDRDERPQDAPSIKAVAEIMDTSRVRVKKLLITAEYYSTALSRRVGELSAQGLSKAQIGQETGLSHAGVSALLPYEKGAYKLADPPGLAENCRVFRRRKLACEKLSSHPEDMDLLWEALLAFENYPFQRGKLRYLMKEGSLCFGEKSFSRQEIEEAYRKVRRLQQEEGCVREEDCCKELFPVFVRLGACKPCEGCESRDAEESQ